MSLVNIINPQLPIDHGHQVVLPFGRLLASV